MGLDFVQSDAHWSYSGFNAFRRRLSLEIGFDLLTMQGFRQRDRIEDPAIPGTRSWSEIDDAIVPLLHHSDCEGELSPRQCAQVAPRLRELVTHWPDDYDHRMALLLADDMDKCAQDGVALEFC